MTYKTWILRSDLGARGTTDAFIRAGGRNPTAPLILHNSECQWKAHLVYRCQKQTNEKKEVEEKLDQKGMYKWHILWTDLLYSQGIGEAFHPRWAFCFYFQLCPIPGPSPHWRAAEKIDLTKAWDRMTHRAVLEASQFPSIDVAPLSSSGVGAGRGLVTASCRSSWRTRHCVESLRVGWAAECSRKHCSVISGNAALFGNSGNHRSKQAKLACSRQRRRQDFFFWSNRETRSKICQLARNSGSAVLIHFVTSCLSCAYYVSHAPWHKNTATRRAEFLPLMHTNQEPPNSDVQNCHFMIFP